MKPTYDELESELHQTRAELTQTQELLKKAFVEIDRLVGEVTKLKEKIDKNSENSSKPPSTDRKGNTDPDKPKKKRKGRKGKVRTPYPKERINHHIDCALDNCPHCGSVYIQWNGSSELLQQVELPKVEAIVTEYELLKYNCLSCRKNSIASAAVRCSRLGLWPKTDGTNGYFDRSISSCQKRSRSTCKRVVWN